MSYRGQITLANLHFANQAGFRPEARVFLQEILPNGLAGPQVHEVHGWSQLTVGRVIGGKGRATISLSNIDDRFFTSKSLRVYDQTNKDQIKSYLQDALSRALPFVREISSSRRAGLSSSFQGVRSFTKEQLADYVDYLYNFAANSPVQKRGTTKVPQDLVDLGLMQRVFIDVKGQDGLWYAAFSGIVSGVTDEYTPGSDPKITLICSDLWRLFGLTEINLQVGPDPIQDTLLFDVQIRAGDLQGGINSTILDGLDGVDVIQRVLTFTQAALCFQSYQAINSSTNVVRNDFFYEEPFWNLPSDIKPIQGSYQGLNTLRRVDDNQRVDGDGIYDGCPVSALIGNYLVDSNIRRGLSGEVYQRLIRRILGLWQTQHVSGDALMKKVADATFFDIYLNGNGDLVYQIPRYNNAPGEYSPTFVSVSQTEASSSAIPLDKAEYDMKNEGLFDFVSNERSFPVKYHGFNYLITDLGLRGWKLTSSEEPIVTGVRVPGGGDLLTQGAGQQINTYVFTGRTLLDDVCGIPFGTVGQIQRRYGVRVRETQQIFIPDLYGSSNPRALLDAFALAVMQQINSTALAGSNALNIRPDLDVGNNVMIVERQRLYYVTGIDHQVNLGRDASTTLTLSYGHDIGVEVPLPWLSIREEIRKISLKPADTPAKTQNLLPPSSKAPTIGINQSGQVITAPHIIGAGSHTLVVPVGQTGVERVFGKFTYVRPGQALPNGSGTCNATGGHICVVDEFEANNIITLEVILPRTTERLRVHKLAAPFFKAVFNRIRNDPKLQSEKIVVIQTYAPRLVWNDPAADRLSYHSWGIAIDIAVGTHTRNDGQWIAPKNELLRPHFQEFGYYWGGNFKRRDDVHFQLAYPESKGEYRQVAVTNADQVE